jgi:large subunit ribosomal protein L19
MVDMHLAMMDANTARKRPEFAIGDTVRVAFKFLEDGMEKGQVFEGTVIARKGRGINETFTVRKISYGVGVERIFPMCSPQIQSVSVVRRGRVRRAKLYYLRHKVGRAARTQELQQARDDGSTDTAA